MRMSEIFQLSTAPLKASIKVIVVCQSCDAKLPNIFPIAVAKGLTNIASEKS